MTALIDRFHLRRLRTLATGYAGFHATNSGLSIVYTLAQTLVLSRVLDHRTFSQIVAIQAAGLYLQPFNQAVARGNFVLLRERIVRKADATRLPEAAAAFQFNQLLFLMASLFVPTLVGASSVAQLQNSLAALQRSEFSDDELAEIDRYAVDGEINIWASSSSA